MGAVCWAICSKRFFRGLMLSLGTTRVSCRLHTGHRQYCCWLLGPTCRLVIGAMTPARQYLQRFSTRPLIFAFPDIDPLKFPRKKLRTSPRYCDVSLLAISARGVMGNPVPSGQPAIPLQHPPDGLQVLVSLIRPPLAGVAVIAAYHASAARPAALVACLVLDHCPTCLLIGNNNLAFVLNSTTGSTLGLSTSNTWPHRQPNCWARSPLTSSQADLAPHAGQCRIWLAGSLGKCWSNGRHGWVVIVSPGTWSIGLSFTRSVVT